MGTFQSQFINDTEDQPVIAGEARQSRPLGVIASATRQSRPLGVIASERGNLVEKINFFMGLPRHFVPRNDTWLKLPRHFVPRNHNGYVPQGNTFFLFRCGQKLFDNGQLTLNKYLKTSGGHIGILFAL